MKEKIAEFLVQLAARGLASRTIQYRRWALGRLEKAGFDVGRYLAGLPPDPSSRQQMVSTLRQFLVFVGRKEEADSLPHCRVPARAPLRPPTPEEVKRLLLSCEGADRHSLRNRAILELMYSSGLRACEVTRLELADLDLGKGLVRVRGKGGRERTAPIGKAAVGWHSRYLALGRPAFRPKTEALFVSRFGRGFSPTGLGSELKRVMRRAGFGPELTAHGLRRAAATHSMKAGMNLREVQEFLGHRKLETTVWYTGLGTEEVREALERLHPRNRMEARDPRISSTDAAPPDSIAPSL